MQRVISVARALVARNYIETASRTSDGLIVTRPSGGSAPFFRAKECRTGEYRRVKEPPSENTSRIALIRRGRKLRRFLALLERLILVVKLLRAYGGCLGVRRL